MLNANWRADNMNKETWIMSGVVTVLFVLMITGFTLRQTAIKNNNEAYPNNWKFGDWKDEVKPQNPIVENVNKTEEVKEQIVASTYDEALKIAKEKKMEVFIFFYGSGCHWCDKMKSVLSDKDVEKSLKKYVYLTVNASKDKNIANKYKVRAIPHFVIANSEGEAKKSNAGYMSKDTLINWM